MLQIRGLLIMPGIILVGDSAFHQYDSLLRKGTLSDGATSCLLNIVVTKKPSRRCVQARKAFPFLLVFFLWL